MQKQLAAQKRKRLVRTFAEINGLPKFLVRLAGARRLRAIASESLPRYRHD